MVSGTSREKFLRCMFSITYLTRSYLLGEELELALQNKLHLHSHSQIFTESKHIEKFWIFLLSTRLVVSVLFAVLLIETRMLQGNQTSWFQPYVCKVYLYYRCLSSRYLDKASIVQVRRQIKRLALIAATIRALCWRWISVNLAMSLPLMLALIYYSNHWN
jgi:hypothetical protein